MQARSAVRPAAQAESAVDRCFRSSEAVASVSQVGTGSQAAGAVEEWQGFASVDEGQDDDSCAEWSDDHSARATGQGMSSAYQVEAVVEAPRLSEQQGSSGFDGFDVVSGRPTPDLIALPADKAVKAKQPSGEPGGERRSRGEATGERRNSGEPNGERRKSGEPNGERGNSGEPRGERRGSGEPISERRGSGVGSKGPLHDTIGSGGYAASSWAAANARRSSDQQRAQPSMQIPVPSPKLSGTAHQQKALCYSSLILLCCWRSCCSQL